MKMTLSGYVEWRNKLHIFDFRFLTLENYMKVFLLNLPIVVQ